MTILNNKINYEMRDKFLKELIYKLDTELYEELDKRLFKKFIEMHRKFSLVIENKNVNVNK